MVNRTRHHPLDYVLAVLVVLALLCLGLTLISTGLVPVGVVDNPSRLYATTAIVGVTGLVISWVRIWQQIGIDFAPVSGYWISMIFFLIPLVTGYGLGLHQLVS